MSWLNDRVAAAFDVRHQILEAANGETPKPQAQTRGNPASFCVITSDFSAASTPLPPLLPDGIAAWPYGCPKRSGNVRG